MADGEKPTPGHAHLLVFRVAEACGCWCATGEGEGERAPRCHHGEVMLPTEPRMGFAAVLQPEQAAVLEVREGRSRPPRTQPARLPAHQ